MTNKRTSKFANPISNILAIIMLTFAVPLASVSAAESTVTYSSHIANIIHTKCSGCHRPGQSGPFPLLTYNDVSERADTIAAVLDSNYMPPWKNESDQPFHLDRRLSAQQRRHLDAWLANGTPLGDPTLVPEPPQFPADWQLGKPDVVVTMRGRYQVPASGPDVYRSFVFPVNLPKDKWVKAIEIRSQAPSTLHHALFFVDPDKQARQQDGKDGQAGVTGMKFLARSTFANASRWRGQPRLPAISLGGYVPGTTPMLLPGDNAMLLPAGADVVMQVHFHPSGKPETEKAQMAFYFADGPPSRQLTTIMVPPLFGRFANIDIPAGKKRHVLTDSYTLPVDVRAIRVSGHAHYLGKEMYLNARLPNGERLNLLRISDWDLDWQDTYQFRKPILLPAGTVLHSRIVYDNSAANPSNPHSPPKRVRWGRQSEDEMGNTTLQVIAVKEADQAVLFDSVRNHVRQTIVTGLRDGQIGPLSEQGAVGRWKSLRKRWQQKRGKATKTSAQGSSAAPTNARSEVLSDSKTPDGIWRDTNGRAHDILHGDGRFRVVTFVSTDCPIANAYQPVLRAMRQDFRDAPIDFYQANPTRSCSLAEAKQHIADYQIDCPVILDGDQSLARRLSARVTPEAFLLAPDGNILYHGRIDDLYAGYGKKRRAATSHDLRNAITAALRGESPGAEEAKQHRSAIGCLIQYQ